MFLIFSRHNSICVLSHHWFPRGDWSQRFGKCPRSCLVCHVFWDTNSHCNKSFRHHNPHFCIYQSSLEDLSGIYRISLSALQTGGYTYLWMSLQKSKIKRLIKSFEDYLLIKKRLTLKWKTKIKQKNNENFISIRNTSRCAFGKFQKELLVWSLGWQFISLWDRSLTQAFFQQKNLVARAKLFSIFSWHRKTAEQNAKNEFPSRLVLSCPKDYDKLKNWKHNITEEYWEEKRE